MYRVRHLRYEKGWNQNELAFHADLAPSVISQIETGKREPSATTLRKLADALGVDVPDLFMRTEPVDPGKARAAASQAYKAAADAKKQAREFGHEVAEAQSKDLLSRALEEREAGNDTQYQLLAHKRNLLLRRVVENADRLRNAFHGLLAHTEVAAGSQEVEELRAGFQEFEALRERMNEAVKEVAPLEVSEEEAAALREQAQGESA